MNFEKFLSTEELQAHLMNNKQVDVANKIQEPLLMQPGDTVFMHPRLIHGSWPNTSNQSRRVLINPKKRSCTNPSPLKKERCSIR